MTFERLSSHVTGRVDEVSLTRPDFLEHFRYRRPVIAKGAAQDLPAFKQWDLDYLIKKIGSAQIIVSKYRSGSNNYNEIEPVDMKFSEYARKFREPGFGQDLYLFNIAKSSNFWTNKKYGVDINPDFASLDDDFQAPAFLKREELVYAQIILGSGTNATRLHYDWGGEAKCLIQLRGRKHVLLVAPEHAHAMQLNGMVSNKNPSTSKVDIRGEALTNSESLKQLGVLEAVLEPGDVLYWPSFWAHDVVNLDDYTLAINAPVDELPMNPLFARHATMVTLTQVLNDLLRANCPEETVIAVLTAFSKYERELLKGHPFSTLWDWTLQPTAEVLACVAKYGPKIE
jgi:Cupin-like domain